MTGNLDIGNNTINGIRSSPQDNAALTLSCVMQGNIGMGGQSILNLRPFAQFLV